MRNILQYPITRTEIKGILETVRDGDKGVGSISPSVFAQLVKKVDDDSWFDSTFDNDAFSRK